MKNFINYNFNISSISLCLYVAPGAGAPVHNNRKNHGIVFYPNGDCTFNFQNRSISVKPNSFVYLPKNSSYTVANKSPSGCYVINFDTDEKTDFEPFAFTVKNSSGFFELFKTAERTWRTRKSGYEIKCKSLAYDILYQLIKEYNLGYISKYNSTILSPALDYIHQNYTYDNINIASLAEMCGISETYFRRIFNKIYGLSPIKYINSLKISRAKDLIASGMYTISEIAELSGFHDESYFSREFKKATGSSPSEY